MAMGTPGSEAQGPLCAQRCLQPVIDVCEIVRHIRLAHHPLRLGAVEADALTIWRARAGMQHDEGEGEEERERE